MYNFLHLAKGNSLGIAKSLDEAISDAARDHAAEVASNNRYLRLAGADGQYQVYSSIYFLQFTSAASSLFIFYDFETFDWLMNR